MDAEKLIGRKIRGFKFDDTQILAYHFSMDILIGRVGIISKYIEDEKAYIVNFGRYEWLYPSDLIEAHLVDNEVDIKREDLGFILNEVLNKALIGSNRIKQPNSNNIARFLIDYLNNKTFKVENEIPTLSDGVMMLVSDNGVDWEKREVIGKTENYFYTWNEHTIAYWEYCKPLEPTKEEELTAILGSSEKVSEIMELFKN